MSEEFRVPLERLQAMVGAQTDLLLAIVDELPNRDAVIARFAKESQQIQDLLLNESDLTDEDLDNQQIARGMLIGMLQKGRAKPKE